MSRKALRWAILIGLLALVAALGIRNSLVNARLLSGLESGEQWAFTEFADRQDNYNMLQSEEVEFRQKVAKNLANFKGSGAAKLGATLLRDPDPEVRAELVAALAGAAKRDPETFAKNLSAAGASERAGLIEAASRAGDAGLKVAELAFRSPETRATASLLFVRFGHSSKHTLAKLLSDKDSEVRISAAETLGSIGAADNDTPEIGERIWKIYSALDRGAKDRLFFALAEFAPKSAASEFAATLKDALAPARLRMAAAAALGKLAHWQELQAALSEVDKDVAHAAAIALANAGEKGTTVAMQSGAPDSVVLESLAANRHISAEDVLIAGALAEATRSRTSAIAALGTRTPLSERGLFVLNSILNSPRSRDEARIAAAHALAAHGQKGAEILKRSLSRGAAAPFAAEALKRLPNSSPPSS